MNPVVCSATYMWIFVDFETDFNRACCEDSETGPFFSEIPKLSELEHKTCKSVHDFLEIPEKLMTSAYVINLVSFLSCQTDVGMLQIVD